MINKATVVIEMDEEELWDAYVILSNLVDRPSGYFYETATKKLAARLADEFYRVGKEKYSWTWLDLEERSNDAK